MRMTKSVHEKRSSVRFPYTHSVSYLTMGNFVRIPTAVDIHGEMLDLSAYGMKIRLQGQLPDVGTVFHVRVPISVSNDKVTVPVLAQVRWVREISPEDHQVGLQFMI